MRLASDCVDVDSQLPREYNASCMIENDIIIAGQRVVLREKRFSDADTDYAWRCDAELARYDATAPLKLSVKEYTLYYIEQLNHPRENSHWFAIDSLDGRHIGNCMYYDVEEGKKQAKIGIIIGDRDYWGRGYGTEAISLLVSHIFEKTKLDRLYLDTLVWNVRAQRCFQKCGFVVCARINKKGDDFLIMELYRGWFKLVKDEGMPQHI